MFSHILVPVDFSDQNKRALDIAFDIASIRESKVSLLHVIEIIADTTFDEFENFYRTLEERAHQRMDRLIIPYQSSHPKIEERIVYGNRAEEILTFIEEQGIDLVIMNSHRLDTGNDLAGWGTISYKVGILAPCPIMLVKR